MKKQGFEVKSRGQIYRSKRKTCKETTTQTYLREEIQIHIICTTKTDDDRLFLAQAECGVLGLCRPSSPSCLTSQLAPPVRSTAQDPAFLGSLLDWPLAFFLPSLLDFTS